MDTSKKPSDETTNKNMDNVLLSVKEAATAIEETPNVVRNWIKQLRAYIPLKKDSNGYNLFDHEALETLMLIKELHRNRGYSVKQIEHYLATGGEIPKPPQIEEKLGEDINEMKQQLQELMKQNEQQSHFNEALIKKLDEQNQYIEKRLNERDKMLMESLRTTLEQTKQIAASREEGTKKKGLFNRLFKK